MNYFIRLFIFSLTCYFCVLSIAGAQNSVSEPSSSIVKATLLEASTMTINGSSTLHDWEVDATGFTVQFQIPEAWFESEEIWAGNDVSQLSVTVPVEHLDGGKNKMNRDLREALKFPGFQTIRFTWEQIVFTGEIDTGRRAEVDGQVTIAGETRQVRFEADLGLNEWSQIVASGSAELNMKDFGIEPPTAFFGVIRTDEKVDLTFELYFGNE